MTAITYVTLPLARLRRDGDTQSRAAMDGPTVEDYAALYRRGVQLPAVSAVFDGLDYWPWDGFHRLDGAALAGLEEIDVEVQEGDVALARWLSLGANRTHGLPRTNDDKRKCVERALKAKPGESDGAIAAHVGVDHKTVAAARDRLEATREIPELNTRTGRDGKTRDTSNIGGKPARKLCPRCQRTGPVKNCAACTDENRTKPAQPRPKKPDDRPPVLDDFGNPVPSRCRDAFCDPWIQESIDFLAVHLAAFWSQRLADGMNDRKRHYPFFTPEDFIDGCAMVGNTMELMVEHLKANRPAGVCPSCKGEGCGACRMSGLVSRELYLQLKEKAA